MPLIRAQRLLNSIEANTTNASSLQALIVSDTGRQGELNNLFTMRGQCRRISASGPVLAAFGGSNTAAELTVYHKQFYNVIANSRYALTNIGTNRNNQLYKAAANNDMAITKLIAGWVDYDPTNYNTITDVINTTDILVLANSAGGNAAAAIANSVVALGTVVTANLTTMFTPLTANINAFQSVVRSPYARDVIGSANTTQWRIISNTDYKDASYAAAHIGIDPTLITNYSTLASNTTALSVMANTANIASIVANSSFAVNYFYGNTNFINSYVTNNINGDAVLKLSTQSQKNNYATDITLMNLVSTNTKIWLNFLPGWFGNTQYSITNSSMEANGFGKPSVSPTSMIFAYSKTGSEIIRTTDGVNFTAVFTSGIDFSGKSTYADGWFFFTAGTGAEAGIAVSSNNTNDGTAYVTSSSAPFAQRMYDVVKTTKSGSTYYVAVGTNTIVRTNANALPNVFTNWAQKATPAVDMLAVDVSNEYDRIIAVGAGGQCWTSNTMAETWSNVTTTFISAYGVNNANDIKYIPASNTFLVVGASGKIMTGDAVTWNVPITVGGGTQTLNDIEIINGIVFVSASGGRIYTADATDLTTWTESTTQIPTTTAITGTTSFNGKIYASGGINGASGSLFVAYK